MDHHNRYTELLQWHDAIEVFDYNPVVDWAMTLISRGIESENILILSSFSVPVSRYEIKPFVSGALRELNLVEKYGDGVSIVLAHYYLGLILADRAVRQNLTRLFELYNHLDHDFGLSVFYCLYFAWSDLEEMGIQYYYDGADLNNIEALLKEEARIWIDHYIHGEPLRKLNGGPIHSVPTQVPSSDRHSLWLRLKVFFSRN